MPYQRAAEVILARWREVERTLAGADVDPDEAQLLQAQAERLRNEYQAFIRAARENNRPEPPPFPETVT